MGTEDYYKIYGGKFKETIIDLIEVGILNETYILDCNRTLYILKEHINFDDKQKNKFCSKKVFYFFTINYLSNIGGYY